MLHLICDTCRILRRLHASGLVKSRTACDFCGQPGTCHLIVIDGDPMIPILAPRLTA